MDRVEYIAGCHAIRDPRIQDVESGASARITAAPTEIERIAD